MKYKTIGFNLNLWLSACLVAILGVLAFRNVPSGQPTNIAIDPTIPMVALTFDDDPNPRFTPQVLDILAENQAYATFLSTEKI